MNNKIKGIVLLIISLCFGLYAVCQILAVSVISSTKLNEPIQLQQGREYRLNYEHNILDAFNIYNNYKISLVFDKKSDDIHWAAYELKNIKYKINIILKNKNRTFCNSIVDKTNLIGMAYGHDYVSYDIYRYNFDIYKSNKYTLIIKILETDPILAELNPRVEVYNYLECGLEGLFWLPTLLVTFILFIVTFVFGIKFLVTKSK